MIRFRNILKHENGFSLVEMLISMVIFSIVMGIIYTYLLQTKNDLTESQVELNIADNAQTAVNTLRKDLYQIGIGRDSDLDQPQILRAGMYDLIFVSDLDREIRNPDNRYGSPDRDITVDFISGKPYFPLAFFYNDSIPHPLRSHGWDHEAIYGYKNIGAEIVRFSLDVNSDNIINYLDLEDQMEIELDRTHTLNPQDFWLNKEWWGCIKGSTGYENGHSGNHPVAFNLKGMYYDSFGSITSSEVSEFIYPNGHYPAPLFTYWGHFYNTITNNDDPSDDDWPGEPIELWGDWGGTQPGLNMPSSPDPNTGARDGVLNDREIAYLYDNRVYSRVNLTYLVSHSGGIAGEAEGQDLNGNGIPGENRIDQFVRRIGVTVTTESDSPLPKKPNLKRSNLSNPNNPVYYEYQDYEISVNINPRNLAYGGSPKIDLAQFTPTPIPPTPTPIPPTNTPAPGTPTNTPAFSATPTVAPTMPTPGAYDPDDSEVIFGDVDGNVHAFAIDNDSFAPVDLCSKRDKRSYFIGLNQEVIDLEPANFCDPVTAFDEWNDLVVATDANNGAANLYYSKHESNIGINGFSFPFKSSVVGYDSQDTITCVEVGNLGTFGLGVSTEYDEVAVAYHRDLGEFLSHTFIEIFFLNSVCGDLISTGSNLPILDINTQMRIQDMVIADFDADGLGELVVMFDVANSAGIPQIRYYPNLDNIPGGWSDFHEYYIDWGADEVRCAKVFAGVITPGIPKQVEPDLIIVANNGDFRISPNLKTNTPGNFPFYTSEIDFHRPAIIDLPLVTIVGAEVYNRQNIELTYEPTLIIAGQSPSDQYYHIVHYNLLDPSNIVPLSTGYGPIYPYDPPIPSPTPVYPNVQPVGLAYAPISNGSSIDHNFIIPSILNITERYFFAMMNPTSYFSLEDAICYDEITSINDDISSVTTTRSAQSEWISYMPTPTPITSPTPMATPTP